MLLIAILLCSVIGRTSLAADESPAWRTLPLVTNGKLDLAWTHLWGGQFEVLDEGVVRTKCSDEGMGLLLYSKETFGNCQIKVVFRSQDEKSNSGVYVRIDEGVLQRKNDPQALRERDANGKLTSESLKRLEQASDAEKESWYPVHHGYEIQICDAGDGTHRTGAVYSLAAATAIPKKQPNAWRTMIITLNGNKVAVEVDGTAVSTFDSESSNLPERKNWFEPKREPKRPQVGYIGLQSHDPGDVVDFKEISVRPLPSK